VSKKLHVDCFLVGNSQAEAFRQLVREYNEPSGQEEPREAAEAAPLVEVLYEEAGRDCTGFDLWFTSIATGFRFGLHWGERRAELARQPASPTYPQFLYHPKRRTWLRYNSAAYFCLVSETNLQVRRERPQELWKPDEVQVITEAAFLENYQRIAQLMRERAEHHLATYQRRGSVGNEWFYCNFIYASGSRQLLPRLRLNVSVNDYSRSWQLLYDVDLHASDARRVASTQPEFEQQLHELLREAEAAATGQEGGPGNG